MFNIYVDPPPDMLVFTSASGSMWCNINLKRGVRERDTLDDTLTNYLLYIILLNVSHMGELRYPNLIIHTVMWLLLRESGPLDRSLSYSCARKILDKLEGHSV